MHELFPQPERPTSASFSPALTSKLMPRSTVFSGALGYANCTLSKRSPAGGAADARLAAPPGTTSTPGAAADAAASAAVAEDAAANVNGADGLAALRAKVRAAATTAVAAAGLAATASDKGDLESAEEAVDKAKAAAKATLRRLRKPPPGPFQSK